MSLASFSDWLSYEPNFNQHKAQIIEKLRWYENETYRLQQRIRGLESEKRDWIAANAPGGWIDDLRSASQPGGGEAERDAFERVMFYAEGAVPGCIALERIKRGNCRGDYRDLDTHEAWEIWQEACKWQRAATGAGNGEG